MCVESDEFSERFGVWYPDFYSLCLFWDFRVFMCLPDRDRIGFFGVNQLIFLKHFWSDCNVFVLWGDLGFFLA